MIKKNELRIGNLVDYNGEIVKVSAITMSGIFTEDRKKIDFMQLNPIELTDKLAFSLGFDNSRKWKVLQIKCGSVFMEISKPKLMGEWQNTFCWVYNEFMFIEIPFVHTLQNLFFMLSMNEDLQLSST